MRRIEEHNYEAPIEEYPGYVGIETEGYLSFIKELQFLEDTWNQFRTTFLDSNRDAITLTFVCEGVTFEVEVDEENCWRLANVLDQLPSFEVLVDDGPPDAGPAAGRTFVFTLADGFGMTQLIGIARALEGAMRGRGDKSAC